MLQRRKWAQENRLSKNGRHTFSVAIIGADGAGKTTIAKRLEASFPQSVKYLYMGVNVGSSNVALPSSRLIEYAKKMVKKKRNQSNGQAVPAVSAERESKLKILWRPIRLVNRLAEEWYRQFLSWKYRRSGHIVIYDRHFKFDYELPRSQNGQQKRHITDWLHRWCLAHLFPQPDLVIFLDAPPEILQARKPVEDPKLSREEYHQYLVERQQAFLNQGKTIRNFQRVDATRNPEDVYLQVTKCMQRYSPARKY